MLLGVIKKETHRMSRILTEFSTYVRPNEPHPAAFDISFALRTMVADLARGGAPKVP